MALHQIGYTKEAKVLLQFFTMKFIQATYTAIVSLPYHISRTKIPKLIFTSSEYI
jgi:hypothetical protein